MDDGGQALYLGREGADGLGLVSRQALEVFDLTTGLVTDRD